MQKFIEPEFNKDSFTCPHCFSNSKMKFANINEVIELFSKNLDKLLKDTLKTASVYDRQIMALFDAFKSNIEQTNRINIISKANICQCQACENISIWLDEKMVYPTPKFTLPPNEDLPEEIKKLYLEASEIVEQSPCGACALLRLALQKMFEELNLYKKDLNTSIGELIQNKKINRSLLKALETVRVCGNNAVHEGVVLLDDDKEIAKNLFKLINFIAEKLITEEKEINEFYGNLPNNKKRLEQ